MFTFICNEIAFRNPEPINSIYIRPAYCNESGTHVHLSVFTIHVNAFSVLEEVIAPETAHTTGKTAAGSAEAAPVDSTEAKSTLSLQSDNNNSGGGRENKPQSSEGTAEGESANTTSAASEEETPAASDPEQSGTDNKEKTELSTDNKTD